MRRVAIVAFPGVQPLDVVGPSDVFVAAGGYEVEVLAPQAGPIPTRAG